MAGSNGQLPLWGWLLFGGLVVILLLVDLVTTSGDRAESRRWALGWSILWVGTGLAFTAAVWLLKGGGSATEYLAVFLLEKSLSLDNLFVFLIIFGSLNIEKRYQHKALLWGIIGAAVFRGLFIVAGTAALERFHWVVYIFAAVLLYAAWATWREDPTEEKDNRAVQWLSRRLPVSTGTHGGHFVARENGKWVFTSLAVALVAIELSDIMFAVDSIAAALSMTHDRFVLYSANIFAILGLRALYLLMAHLIRDWPYLHYGIALVLGFTALKLLLDPIYKIPIWVSLIVIVGTVGWCYCLEYRERPADGSALALSPEVSHDQMVVAA